MKSSRLLLIGIFVLFLIMVQASAYQPPVPKIKLLIFPFDIQERNEPVMNTTVYGWYDLNGDHLTTQNELETFTKNSVQVPYCNSTNNYPAGEMIIYQAFAPGYYPTLGSWRVPSVYEYDYQNYLFYEDLELWRKTSNVSLTIYDRYPSDDQAPLRNYDFVIRNEEPGTALGLYNFFMDWQNPFWHNAPALVLTIPAQDVNDVFVREYDHYRIVRSMETNEALYFMFYYMFSPIHYYRANRGEDYRALQIRTEFNNPFDLYATIVDSVPMNSNNTYPIGIPTIPEKPILRFNGNMSEIEITTNNTAVDMMYDFYRVNYGGGIDYAPGEGNIEEPPNLGNDNYEFPVFPQNPIDKGYFMFPDDPFLDFCAVSIMFEFTFGIGIIIKYRKRKLR